MAHHHKCGCGCDSVTSVSSWRHSCSCFDSHSSHTGSSSSSSSSSHSESSLSGSSRSHSQSSKCHEHKKKCCPVKATNRTCCGYALGGSGIYSFAGRYLQNYSTGYAQCGCCTVCLPCCQDGYQRPGYNYGKKCGKKHDKKKHH